MLWLTAITKTCCTYCSARLGLLILLTNKEERGRQNGRESARSWLKLASSSSSSLPAFELHAADVAVILDPERMLLLLLLLPWLSLSLSFQSRVEEKEE